MEIRELYFITILLFPISTLFQGYFSGLNKLIFGVLLIMQIALTLMKIRRKDFLIILIMFMSFFYNIISTNGKPYNTNEFFYYPFAVLFLLYMSDNIFLIDRFYIKHRKLVCGILNLWTLLVGFSFLLPSSYKSSWGGARYFSSFCGSVWRLAPTCIFIMSLALGAMIIYRQKKMILYSIIPMVSLYMGGSRTYIMVGLILFMIYWYYFSRSKRMFYWSIPCVAIVLISLIWKTAMADKINAVSYTADSYFDFWGTVTSGRSIFWSAEIKEFFESKLINKVLGNGLNLVYEINEKAFGGLVWAHNDFLQCLISHGLVGLLIYIYSIRRLLSIIWVKKTGRKEIIPILGCICVWLINAMFNMFYTYFCSMLAFPFLVYVVQHGKEEGFQKV